MSIVFDIWFDDQGERDFFNFFFFFESVNFIKNYKIIFI